VKIYTSGLDVNEYHTKHRSGTGVESKW